MNGVRWGGDRCFEADSDMARIQEIQFTIRSVLKHDYECVQTYGVC